MLAATLFQAYAQKMTFTPQWTPQSQFAGYYAALANGYYADAGLRSHSSIPRPHTVRSACSRMEQPTSSPVNSYRR